jgi:hypothetical protein
MLASFLIRIFSRDLSPAHKTRMQLRCNGIARRCDVFETATQPLIRTGDGILLYYRHEDSGELTPVIP